MLICYRILRCAAGEVKKREVEVRVDTGVVTCQLTRRRGIQGSGAPAAPSAWLTGEQLNCVVRPSCYCYMHRVTRASLLIETIDSTDSWSIPLVRTILFDAQN